MRMPHEVGLAELMGVITSITPTAHVRLALTRDTDGSWVARSLVVDVFPAVWLGRQEGPLSEWIPPVELHDYQGKTLLYAGYESTESIAQWFAHPDECELTEYDNRPGYKYARQRFRLAELQEIVPGQRVFSGQNDFFARLPWPHYIFVANLKGPNFYNGGDHHALYTAGHPHFDNLREARGHFIHGLDDLRSYQDRDQFVIRVVDADGWIHKASLKGRQLNVEVRGLKLYPAQIILKGTGLKAETKDLWGSGPVAIDLKSDAPPDFRVILANEQSGELDQVWRTQFPGPLDTSSPHFDVEQDESDHQYVRIAPDIQAEYSAAPTGTTLSANRDLGASSLRSNTKRELRVIVASPGDVKRERESIPAILDELNEGIAGQLGLRLTSWLWETDSYPGFHVQGPQGQIDDQMRIQEADIVIGIFWTRIGSPLPDGKSGTQHELLKAYEAWTQMRSPDILVYFNQKQYRPKSISDMNQWSALWSFKDELQSKGLLGTYPNPSRFPDTLRRDLQRLLIAEYAARDN